MRLTFLLPDFRGGKRSGGYKVHYEYANRLARRGHRVAVVQRLRDPIHLEPTRLRAYARRYRLIGRSDRRLTWFNLDPAVHLKLVNTLSARHLPTAEVLIATGWQTTAFARAQSLSKGTKFYIVYDYEFLRTWDALGRRRIEATYTDDFHIVATSSIVRETVKEYGVGPVATIPCGLDLGVYKTVRPTIGRPARIGFPVRLEPQKHLEDALAALEMVLSRRPHRSVTAVGYGPERPRRLPAWVEFVEDPSDNEVAALLNDCSIFVLPSHYEGWGLPAVEAMACGAALVTYDNGGSRDYAFHGTTALVARPSIPQALASQVDVLLNNERYRHALAEAGRRHVTRYGWDAAVDALERCLTEVVGQTR